MATIPTKSISRDVDKINSQLEALNKDILDAVQKGNAIKVRELREQVKEIKQSLKEIRNPKPQPEIPEAVQQTNFRLSKMWGDARMNPYWLKLADYLGVKEKDSHVARDKINYILDWAAMDLKTNDMAKIISKVSKTMKKMHKDTGFEKPYQALYRYAKLDSMGKEAKGDTKKAVEMEKKAYEKDPEPVSEENKT